MRLFQVKGVQNVNNVDRIWMNNFIFINFDVNGEHNGKVSKCNGLDS